MVERTALAIGEHLGESALAELTENVLAGRIKKERQKAGLSQRRLGIASRVANNAILRLEQGRISLFRPDIIKRLAEALGTTYSHLTGFDDLPAPPPYSSAPEAPAFELADTGVFGEGGGPRRFASGGEKTKKWREAQEQAAAEGVRKAPAGEISRGEGPPSRVRSELTTTADLSPVTVLANGNRIELGRGVKIGAESDYVRIPAGTMIVNRSPAPLVIHSESDLTPPPSGLSPQSMDPRVPDEVSHAL